MAQHAAETPPQTEAGKQVLEDATTAEQQVNVNKASEFYNLVEDMDEGKVREIGREVQKGYKDDDETRADWLDMHEFWLRLYLQTDYALNSNDERDWGATESVPILTESCDQFQSRTYKAFFPNQTFVSCVPLRHTNNPMERKQLQDRCDRIGRHMSWQLGFQDQNYKRNKRALFLGTAVHGSFFTKAYFDVNKMRVAIDNVRPTDLVVSYNVGPQSIEKVRRKSHVIHKTVGEAQILATKGYLIDAPRSDYGEKKTQYDVAVDEAQGLAPSYSMIKRDAPCTFIEQQFYLDIDDTGEFRPYLGTIDLTTGMLLRLTIDWEADQHGAPSMDYEQIQYYSHYKFMENPDGFYGLGLGAKIGDLNAAVNIGTRQMLDAGTLQNDGNNSGFIDARLCLDGEEDVTTTLGRFKKIPNTMGDLRNGIMPMQFAGPSESLFKLIQALDQRAQRMAGTTEATTGDIQKNQQPTTVLAMIEQGLEMFSSVQMGLADDFGDELKKIYKINQKHMPFVEYFTVNEETEAVTRADYQDDMIIEPIFDPKFSTQAQKMARAQAIEQIVASKPVLAQNPMIQISLARRQLEAMDADNIDELVPPEPPPPADIDNQDVENMMFLAPPNPMKPFDVFPEQHHAEHLQKIHDFVASHGDKVPPEQQQALIAHKQKHESFLFGQQKGLIPPPQPSPPQGMAGGGGNQMGLGPIDQQISGLQAPFANPLNGAMQPAQPPGG